MKKLTGAFIALTFLFSTASPVFADSSADMMAMLESMKQQMNQMQSTIQQQNVRIQELESGKAAEVQAPAAPAPSGADYQTKLSETDWQKGISDNLGTSVPWLKGLKFGGDFRLRYEAFEFDDNNGDENVASDRTRNRFRIRLRFGFEKDYGDDWKVGFRLATGTAGTNGLATDNTSPNVTLGNPGYFIFKDIYVDRAFAQYSPNSLKDYGPIKGVTVGAGKFENPFLRYSTTIVWDADVTPEGAYEKVNLQLVGTEDNKVNLYNTFGQFIFNENSGADADAEIYGYQTALNWSTYNFNSDLPVDFTFAASFYDYQGWSQTVLASQNTVATSYLRTNTNSADAFRVLDLYPEIQFYVGRTPITLWYDYATNLGNHGTEDVSSLGNDIHDMDTAWGLGVKVGKAKKKKDWEFFYGYYEIGANSVVAAFNDSDFGGPGGQGYTNRQGHKFGATYQLTDAVTVNWTGYVVVPLNSGSVVANSANETVFRSQADLSYKF